MPWPPQCCPDHADVQRSKACAWSVTAHAAQVTAAWVTCLHDLPRPQTRELSTSQGALAGNMLRLVDHPDRLDPGSLSLSSIAAAGLIGWLIASASTQAAGVAALDRRLQVCSA